MKAAWLSALAVVVACSCARHPVTTDELVAALVSKGLHVDKTAEMEPKAEWVGAELEADLVLDYEDSYRGVRFSSADLARGHCQEGQHGVPFGAWCLEPVATSPRVETWNKVDLLRR